MATTAKKIQPTSKLSFAQLEALWISAGGSKDQAPVMAAIAEAESSGNVNAINNTAYPNLPNYKPPSPGNSPEYSVGPWQINTVAHKQYTASAMLNPLQNAQAAVSIAGVNGERKDNWSTYNNGAFLSHLPTNAAGIGIPGLGFLSGIGIGGGNSVFSNPLASTGPGAPQNNPVNQVAGDFSSIGKDIIYATIIAGGGLLIIAGILIIAADLGLSAHAVVQKAPPVRAARKITGARMQKRSAQVTSQRQGELHTVRVQREQARVKTEQARATELRTRTRHRAAIAKGTKAEREARDKRMMYEGAQAAATPNLTEARRRKKAS